MALFVWRRLITCGGLVIRLVLIPELFTGRLPIGRRLPTCPTKLVCDRLNKNRRGARRNQKLVVQAFLPVLVLNRVKLVAGNENATNYLDISVLLCRFVLHSSCRRSGPHPSCCRSIHRQRSPPH